MVSTRGVKSVKYKFSEGERVLCYEPDPTKAKVLYDSKVLEVIESKDKRGRRTVEYLIHFQGWNSSWDRCVSEDFVLKDTEENRQLQKDLANKSQLQLGAYLYRRERKKPNATSTSSSSGPPAKRSKQGYEDDGSSSSTQPEETVKEPEQPDTDSSGGSGAKTAAAQEAGTDQQPHSGRAQIVLPAALRNRLTFDYHLVVKRGLLSRLPAQPTVADILEGFLVWFARSGAWQISKNKSEPPPPKPDMRDVISRVNLVREVLDGIRVYFDFILHKHLLYKQELQQYSKVCAQFMDQYNLRLKMKSDPVKKEEPTKDEGEEEEEEDYEQAENDEREAKMIEAAQEELKSPKLPEYAHLPPDPVETVRNPGNTGNPEPKPSTSNDIEEPTQTRHSTRKLEKVSTEEKETVREVKPAQNNSKRPATRGSARRLRSHKSTVSPSEAEEANGSGSSTETKPFETTAGTENSNDGRCKENTETRSPALTASSTRTPLTLLLDKAAKWKVIPREDTEHVPCRIYGAIHLARLFVKLPDFLNATQMADVKLKVILKHIDMFVQYLDDHSEWFGEVYYGDNTTRTE